MFTKEIFLKNVLIDKIYLYLKHIGIQADQHKCVDCKDPNFSGFGYKPSEKCGCCPWPCCCKCVAGEDESNLFVITVFVLVKVVSV